MHEMLNYDDEMSIFSYYLMRFYVLLKYLSIFVLRIIKVKFEMILENTLDIDKEIYCKSLIYGKIEK